MKKSKVKFSWDDTGTIDIDIHGNEYATVRYKPSDKFVQETIAKFAKINGNESKTKSNKLTPINRKPSQKRFNSLTGGISKRASYGESSQRLTFEDLSRSVECNTRKGNWELLAKNYEDMAIILCCEGKRNDEIKCLLLAFHIRLNTGEFVADRMVIKRIKTSAKVCNVHLSEIYARYRELVRHPILPETKYGVEEVCQIISDIWGNIW